MCVCDVMWCVYVCVALQREVSEVCGEENTSNYQELVEALQTQIDSASE